MRIFREEAQKQPAFRKLMQAIELKQTPANLIGLSGIHKAHYITAAAELSNKKVLVITEDESTARRMCEDINALYRNPLENKKSDITADFAAVYPIRDIFFHGIEGASGEYQQQRNRR